MAPKQLLAQVSFLISCVLTCVLLITYAAFSQRETLTILIHCVTQLPQYLPPARTRPCCGAQRGTGTVTEKGSQAALLLPRPNFEG